MSWLGWEGLELPDALSAASDLPVDGNDASLPSRGGVRFLTAVFFISIIYILYYLTFVVKKPRLFGGGTKLKPHLLAHCPTLQRHYWPTVWAFNCHLTTVLRFILQRHINIQYRRTILTMPDGGEVGLDWGEKEREPAAVQRDAPILLILTGLTGSSSDTYIQYVVEDGLSCGYRSVVFNQRGTGGLLLKTQRMYCATKIDDLQHALNYLRQSFPHSEIVAVGISLGGMIVTQYLHQMGAHSDLKAALVISCVWDVFKSKVSLEDNPINFNLYTRNLCKSLKSLVERNIAAIGEETLKNLPIDLNHVLESKAVSQIDERLVCPLFGYRCLDDYYEAASNWDKMHKIATPLLCLSAIDDPFVPGHSLPFAEFSSNPHTLLAATSRGGHFGFIEGVLPTSGTWMNRVCREFLVAMTHYEQK